MRLKQNLQQHIPNAGCNMPMIPAIEVPNPVKFWKSLNMNEADCLFLLQARIVVIVTMKATILNTRNPFDSLSSTLDPHRFMNAANKVTAQATRTVCHLSITKLGFTRFACPRMKLAQMKLFVAPIAKRPVFNQNHVKNVDPYHLPIIMNQPVR